VNQGTEATSLDGAPEREIQKGEKGWRRSTKIAGLRSTPTVLGEGANASSISCRTDSAMEALAHLRRLAGHCLTCEDNPEEAGQLRALVELLDGAL
jgi:hypothetical protein